MILYAVSDIHAKPDRLELIRSNIATHGPDMVIVAGDIINYTNPAPVLATLNDLSIPVLAVRGNSDPAGIAKYFTPYQNIFLMHLNKITLNGISFTGLSGTIPVPFRTRVCLREKRLMEQVKPMIDSKTVVIVHPPPYGVLDRVIGRFHAGSKMVRSLIIEKQPQLLICGHIHEDAGMGQLEKTIVLNCCMTKKSQGALIEMDGDKVFKIKLL